MLRIGEYYPVLSLSNLRNTTYKWLRRQPYCYDGALTVHDHARDVNCSLYDYTNKRATNEQAPYCVLHTLQILC